MADRSVKPRYESMKTRQVRIESQFNMAISEAETSTAPVSLKESDIPEASLAERKPAELRKANLSMQLLSFFATFFKPTAVIFYQIKLNRFLFFFCHVVSLLVGRVGLQVALRQIYCSPAIHNDLSRDQKFWKCTNFLLILDLKCHYDENFGLSF